MSDFVDSGVTGSVSESGGSSDNSSSVPQAGNETQGNPQGESSALETQGRVDGQINAAPPAEDQIPENDDDLAALPERERTPLINQRQRLRELNRAQAEADAYRTSMQPASDWIAERGGGDLEVGLQRIQADSQIVDALFPANPANWSPSNFWDVLGQQDPTTYRQLYEDAVKSPYVINDVAHGLSNEQIVTLAESRGLTLANATLDDCPQDVKPEVWQAMAPEVRQGFYDMTRQVQDWHINDAAQRHQMQQAQRAQFQQQQAQQKQAAEARIEQQVSHTYNTVKTAVERSIAALYPNNPEAVKDVLRITEQVIKSEDGHAKAVWEEIEGHIRAGEMRQVQLKLPDLITKAKAIASQVNQRFNSSESDARHWRELLRQASPDEILRYVAQQRGGQQQPQPGTGQPVSNTNGNGHVPRPDRRGEYSVDNIRSYIRQN